VNAYILLQIENGRARGVFRELEGLAKTASVDAVAGPYDAVVSVESTSFERLNEQVLEPLEGVDGIIRTLTCFAGLQSPLAPSDAVPGAVLR